MAGNPTATGAQAQLDYVTGRALKWTAPQAVYLALLTSSVPDNVGLSSLPEVATPGYGRQPITWTPATASRPSTSGNATVVTFGPVTADMAAPVTHCALVTAQVGNTGEVLYTWQLDTTQQAVNGQALQIAQNKLTASQS
ncbi:MULTISPECIES: phage tail fiber protein [Streptosporangium]|uniref:Uncharacterized protein n=1 Tax=Streptosporangium brasiliense TaxID=47480 RepID=A0ABT9RM08_9ACTN|nr:hypothetical protein [Streptosporangium brasiliense]MDP9870329.1 hypothetical protein [Streptosporangium brasiliense]